MAIDPALKQKIDNYQKERKELEKKMEQEKQETEGDGVEE